MYLAKSVIATQFRIHWAAQPGVTHTAASGTMLIWAENVDLAKKKFFHFNRYHNIELITIESKASILLE